MKTVRIFIMFFLSLVLLCSVLPTASADIIYPAPGNVPAGSYLNHLVATVQSGSPLSYVPEALPPGVEFVTEQGLDGINVFLRGTPMLAGNYNCTLTIGDGSALCPLTVTPAMPSVTSTGNVTCLPGETVQIAVNAYTVDGGSLSYQWYYSQSASNSFGFEIPGETQPVYNIGTGFSGVNYYYCVVTNTNNGYSLSTASSAISVSVLESSVTSVTLHSYPYITAYSVGDIIDTTGLQLDVAYSDGRTQVISQDFAVTPYYLTTPGTQPVEVDYQGFKCVFYVSVQEPQDQIDGISVLTLPYKVRYTVGEFLETSGLTLRVYSRRGYEDISSGFSCSPTTLSTLGEQEIYVFYGDKSCSFTVTVEEAERPVSLVVSAMPNKTTYQVGESLDITGLTLRQITSRQNSETIYSGFVCSPTLLTTVGRQEITVSYGNLTARFTVTVTEVFAGSTQTPAASDVPASVPTSIPTQAPSYAPVPSSAPVGRASHSSHQSNLGRSLIAVIVIAASSALLILGIYIYLMNRRSNADASSESREKRSDRRSQWK